MYQDLIAQITDQQIKNYVLMAPQNVMFVPVPGNKSILSIQRSKSELDVFPTFDDLFNLSHNKKYTIFTIPIKPNITLIVSYYFCNIKKQRVIYDIYIKIQTGWLIVSSVKSIMFKNTVKINQNEKSGNFKTYSRL